MNPKVVQEESAEQLVKELQEIKSGKSIEGKSGRLREIARSFGSHQKWDEALDTFQLITDVKVRDGVIADIIEEFLLPAKKFDLAKKFCHYVVQDQEIKPLLNLRIALAENNGSEAEKIVHSLMSPIAKNFAFMQVIEFYFISQKKDKVKQFCKSILENSRNIYDTKVRSYILREIAISLCFANHEKELAMEAANLIPDETIKSQVLKKIGV
jgi:hypothetical protein